MKSKRNCFLFILSLFFLVSGCQDDKEKGAYSGVSDLIADRNRARYEVEKSVPKKSSRPINKAIEEKNGSASSPQEKDQALSSIILYDEDVRIVGVDSGRTLAKGVAYINKKGQIVRIKILKE